VLAAVSVVIPTRNRGMAFVRALGSALAQTYPIAEIIVSDHNSTDGTEDVVREVMRTEPHVRYVRWDESINITWNWMLGAMWSRGTHVKYLFDDDWLEPECVGTLMMMMGPQTLVAQCGATFEPSGVECYTDMRGLSIPAAVRAGALSVSPVTALHRRDALIASFGQFPMLSQRAFDSGVGPNVLMNYGQVVMNPELHRHTPGILVRLGGDDLPGEARSLTSRLKESDPELLYGEHAAAYDLLDRLAAQ
jgi:glycosyltransferase involved in cell wall biosynthesis